MSVLLFKLVTYGLIVGILILLFRTAVFLWLIFSNLRADPHLINPASNSVKPFNPEILDAGVRGQFAVLTEQVERIGLEPVAYVAHGIDSRMPRHVLVSGRQGACWTCDSTVIEYRFSATSKRTIGFNELCTDFTDGTSLNTMGPSELDSRHDRSLTIWVFPGCNDLDSLIEIHEALVSDSGKVPIPPPRSLESYETHLASQYQLAIDHGVQIGALKRRSDGSYRPTLPSMLKLTWIAYFPGLHKRRMRRKTRAKLKSIGLAHLWKADAPSA